MTETTYVKEIEDSHGDLVGLEFRCASCFERRLLPENAGYLYWFADYRQAIPSDFSTDYTTYCKGCDRVVNAIDCEECDCADPTAMDGLADECDCECHQ